MNQAAEGMAAPDLDRRSVLVVGMEEAEKVAAESWTAVTS